MCFMHLFDALVLFCSIDAVQLTGNISIEFGNGNRAVARSSPLAIEFYKNDVLFVVLNGNGRFTFEEVSIFLFHIIVV